jgi:putative salt-induced outer membrane protein YdiY
MTLRPALATLALATASCGPAAAQVTVKPDGQWRHLIGAAASFASGNSDSSSLRLSYDGVRATESDKWSLTGRALYARDEDETTGERFSAGALHNRDLTRDWFGFGSADALRDRPANLKLRASVAAGLGYHVLRSERGFFDVSAGLGYSQDSYDEATEVDGAERTRYGSFELLLAEESSHQLTDSTAFKQKLRVLPNLRNEGEVRADFESALSVAINSAINLTAGLTYRYDSDPGADVERGDLLFTTGVSWRMD